LEAAGEARTELSREPRLGDRVKGWVEEHGERAALAVAVAQERARREAGGGQVYGGGVWTPLAQHRRLLGVHSVRIAKRAEGLRAELARPRGAVLAAREQWLRKNGDPFAALAGHLKWWMGERAASAATLVAAERELSWRGRVAELERAAQAGELRPPDASVADGGVGAKRLERCERLLGPDGTELVAELATARSGQLQGTNPAVLAALQEEVGDPLEHLDGPGALATQRLKRDWQNAQTEQNDTQVKNRRLRQLARAGQELWDDGTHPDKWMIHHAAAAAVRIAIDTQLERAIAAQQEHTTDTRHRGPAIAVSAPGPPAGMEM
jgi:hypothetical protein